MEEQCLIQTQIYLMQLQCCLLLLKCSEMHILTEIRVQVFIWRPAGTPEVGANISAARQNPVSRFFCQLCPIIFQLRISCERRFVKLAQDVFQYPHGSRDCVDNSQKIVSTVVARALVN